MQIIGLDSIGRGENEKLLKIIIKYCKKYSKDTNCDSRRVTQTHTQLSVTETPSQKCAWMSLQTHVDPFGITMPYMQH